MSEKIKFRDLIKGFFLLVLFIFAIQAVLLSIHSFFTYYLAGAVLGDFFYMFFRYKVELYLEERVVKNTEYQLTNVPPRLRILMFLGYFLVIFSFIPFSVKLGIHLTEEILLFISYLLGISGHFCENLVPYHTWNAVTKDKVIIGHRRVLPRIIETIPISSIESVQRKWTLHANTILNLKSGRSLRIELSKKAEKFLREHMN